MTLHCMATADVRRSFRVTESDLNRYDMMHGGRLVTLCDETAWLAATHHCHCDCLTRAIHRIRFQLPLHREDEFEVRARAALSGRHSIWVHCEVRHDRLAVMDGILVFVAVDEVLQPVEVPPLRAETAEEKQLMQAVRRFRETFIQEKARRDPCLP